MANTGDTFPTAGANDLIPSGPYNNWVNPENITADDATDATCNAAVVGSEYLVGYAFGFSIPSGATINGVVVKIEGSEHAAGTELVSAILGTHSGTTFTTTGSAKSQTFSGTAKAVYTYGTTSDVWSATLTPTIVNGSDFGVAVYFGSAHDVRVDYLTMQIEYTEASGLSNTMIRAGGVIAVP